MSFLKRFSSSLDNFGSNSIAVKDRAKGSNLSVSIAFPGPADYAQGIIGDLPNLPVYRGGVALGAILENHFLIA